MGHLWWSQLKDEEAKAQRGSFPQGHTTREVLDPDSSQAGLIMGSALLASPAWSGSWLPLWPDSCQFLFSLAVSTSLHLLSLKTPTPPMFFLLFTEMAALYSLVLLLFKFHLLREDFYLLLHVTKHPSPIPSPYVPSKFFYSTCDNWMWSFISAGLCIYFQHPLSTWKPIDAQQDVFDK